MSFGGSPIGNFQREVADEAAAAVVRQAWDLGMRYFDTSPLYGFGLGEYRLGAALLRYPRDHYVLSTKVGRLLRGTGSRADSGPWRSPAPFAPVYDYSYDGVLRSVEESLARMGTDRVDILLVHDVDRRTHGEQQPCMFRLAVDHGFKALERLRQEKVVTAIGFGLNEADVCLDAVRQTDADCVLLAGRYTLLEQDPLDDLFPLCLERGVGVILGGVFNSGVLATGAVAGATFDYSAVPPELAQRVRRIESACAAYGVPLAAAALQFAAAHPAVSSICVGAHTTEQLISNVEMFDMDIPAAVWDRLREIALIRDDAPTPCKQPTQEDQWTENSGLS
jgi:D-threo-aldose 1-dehydrogenase